MEEAESLCDRLGSIDQGGLMAIGSPEQLRGMLGERDILRFSGSFDPHKTPRASCPRSSAIWPARGPTCARRR
jgi:ABC-type multidrug transport system ATPase subunit